MDIQLLYFILGFIAIVCLATLVVACTPDKSERNFDKVKVTEIDRGRIVEPSTPLDVLGRQR